MNILTLLQCLSPCLDRTTVRQMSRIIPAILAMTGRVTMLGISRWTEKGGSYRTVQRFFHTVIPWATLLWLFFQHHLYRSEDVYLLAGDECVVTKSGKHTHGLDRFFSSLYGKVVPSLEFFTLSLVSLSERCSYPVMVEQVVRTNEEKAETKAKAQARKVKRKQKKKGKPGRPKGSKNRDKTQVTLTLELRRIQQMVQKLLRLIGAMFPLCYLVMDGKFGNNNALQMTLQCGLHLVSKLRHDAALHFAADGPCTGRGAPRKYGDKINYAALPDQYRQESSTERGIQTNIYQAQMLHQDFAQPLNIVIIHKRNSITGATAHVVLFSSDLELTYAQIIDYYSLRFQIEFNFRDAKQYWGLEDFMNIKETAVINAANLALFMVNVTQVLLRNFRQEDSNVNVLDLKAHFRGLKYVAETIKWLPEKPEPILMATIFNEVSRLGRIHNPLPSPIPP
ncbi:MAG: transposase [Hydrogenovibrio sp.]|uniref:transposase n=1 Tax=Hydrogenovibrio sp. TaxID=2065821 RepID=UPI00287033B6|nr:transposase [Hydrogenovibrio sp.]MDR9500110.1 transposase [Hydrogenovibrio sp.]